MVHPRTIDREKVASLIAEGWTDRRIAALRGCSPTTVNRFRHELAKAKVKAGRYVPSASRKAVTDQDAAFSARLRAAKSHPNAQRDVGSKVSRRDVDSEGEI